MQYLFSVLEKLQRRRQRISSDILQKEATARNAVKMDVEKLNPLVVSLLCRRKEGRLAHCHLQTFSQSMKNLETIIVAAVEKVSYWRKRVSQLLTQKDTLELKVVDGSKMQGDWSFAEQTARYRQVYLIRREKEAAAQALAQTQRAIQEVEQHIKALNANIRSGADGMERAKREFDEQEQHYKNLTQTLQDGIHASEVGCSPSLLAARLEALESQILARQSDILMREHQSIQHAWTIQKQALLFAIESALTKQHARLEDVFADCHVPEVAEHRGDSPPPLLLDKTVTAALAERQTCVQYAQQRALQQRLDSQRLAYHKRQTLIDGWLKAQCKSDGVDHMTGVAQSRAQELVETRCQEQRRVLVNHYSEWLLHVSAHDRHLIKLTASANCHRLELQAMQRTQRNLVQVARQQQLELIALSTREAVAGSSDVREVEKGPQEPGTPQLLGRQLMETEEELSQSSKALQETEQALDEAKEVLKKLRSEEEACRVMVSNLAFSQDLQDSALSQEQTKRRKLHGTARNRLLSKMGYPRDLTKYKEVQREIAFTESRLADASARLASCENNYRRKMEELARNMQVTTISLQINTNYGRNIMRSEAVHVE